MQHYVYLYTDPTKNEPIYVGLGTKKRMTHHLTRTDKHPLTQRIQKMRRAMVLPVISLLGDNLTLEEAKSLEEASIKRLGRKDLGLGPLLNLTDGGDGNNVSPITKAKLSKAHAGKPGTAHTEEAKQAIGQASRERIRPAMSQTQKDVLSVINKAAHAAGKYDDVYNDPARSAKLVEAGKSKWDNAPLLTCQHCGKQMKNWIVFPRWHNDNCKEKK